MLFCTVVITNLFIYGECETMTDQININVVNFGSTQVENNNVAIAYHNILSDIQNDKNITNAISNELAKVNPEFTLSLNQDLNILPSGRKHNTQVLPFSYKDLGLQNAKTLAVYVPSIVDTLGANETVTEKTVNTIMFIAVSGYFLAFKSSNKEFMYNAKGTFNKQTKDIFKNAFGMSLTVDSKNGTIKGFQIGNVLKDIASKNMDSINTIASIKKSDDWKPSEPSKPTREKIICSVGCETNDIVKATVKLLEIDGLNIKCQICNTSFGLESSKSQNVESKTVKTKTVKTNKPSVKDTTKYLVEDMKLNKQTIKN